MLSVSQIENQTMTVGHSSPEQRILQNLNSLKSNGRFIQKGNIEWHRIGFQIDGLINFNPAQGWLMRGVWHSLMGNTQDIHSSIRNVYRLTRSVPVLLDVIGIYTSHGMPSAATQVYAYAANPAHGDLLKALPYAVATGSLQQTVEYLDKARELGMDMAGSHELIQKIRVAARMLDAHGISDDVLARHLDLAGEVMREDQRFQSLPNLHLPAGSPESFLIEYTVDCGPDEAAAFNQSLSGKEKAAGILKSPVYNIIFTAGR